MLIERWQPLLAAATTWVPPRKRTVVVVPHPDDETLSSGGLISAQSARGVDVLVVAVTDGDAAYDPDGDPELAAVRRLEQIAALRHLGVDEDQRIGLGLPDGRVTSSMSDLVERLGSIVSHGDLLIAPWVHDHHPDHEAVGRAATQVARGMDVELRYGLFWAWHHSSPSDFDDVTLWSFAPGADALARKAQALACHRSQLTDDLVDDPILGPPLLEPAQWPCEYFVGGAGR